MKSTPAALAFASLMSLGSLSWADTLPLTFEPGTPTFIGGQGPLQPLIAYARIDTAEDIGEGLKILNATVTAVAPAMVDAALDVGSPATITVDAPYSTVSADLDTGSGYASVRSATFSGGFTISVDAVLPNGRNNPASTGGSFSITGFTVLPDAMKVLANIQGANGVGTQDGVLFWEASQLSGSTALKVSLCPLTPSSPCEPTSLEGFQLEGLSITGAGYDLVIQSLGLTHQGRLAIEGGVGFGSLTVSSVPEPGSAGLMLTGLFGLAWVGRKAALSRQAREV